MRTENNIKLSKPYFENLDALRFLAALSVFIFHFFQEIKSFMPVDGTKAYKLITIFTTKGTLGVNFFFVLSGFLITYLILNEYTVKGSFSLKNFLIRRTLRIWPLYYFIVLLGFVLFPLILPDYYTAHSPLHYVFFLANFDELYSGMYDNVNFLTAPWSVAVEEQFYLCWGTLLFLIKPLKGKNTLAIIGVLTLISLGFGIWHFNAPRILYYHTFSVMINILIGATLAYFYFKRNPRLINLKNISKNTIRLIYIIGFFVIIAKNKIFIGPFAAIEHLILSFFFAFVIFDQIHLKNSFFKFGKIKWFNHLGQISYGLYLYHLVVFYLISNLILPLINDNITSLISFFTLGVTLTYLISRWSYKYFEQPFLRLKDKFN